MNLGSGPMTPLAGGPREGVCLLKTLMRRQERILASVPRATAETCLHACIWYIGIALNAATSIPRSLSIACTHFGDRPIPDQV